MTAVRIILVVVAGLFALYAATAFAVVLAALVVGAWKTYVRPLWRRPRPEPVPALDVARNVRLAELADLMALPSYRLSDADLRDMFDAPALVPTHERGKR
ncbi:MAG TPA: hypothetical protein VFR67_14255 [Pilimelia sp.]|nr:hypothetical protein [Pilimelia sp.]